MELSKEQSIGNTLKALRRASIMPPTEAMGTGRKDSVFNRRPSAIEEITLEDSFNHKMKMASHNNVDDTQSLTSADNEQPGLGVGKLRYRFLTPEEFSDDEEVEVCDIMNAFRDVTTAHGVPHIGNANG